VGERVPTEANDTGITWSRDVPVEIRSLSSLGGAQYGDVFSGPLPVGSHKSAEEWARLALDVTLGRLRAPVLGVQRYLLGLRLEPKSKDRFLGWKVSARGEDWIRLQAASWFLSAEIVFRVEDALQVGCFVRYDRRLGAVVWPPASLVHRQAGLLMMRRVLR
jgi:hypothetical protein